MACARGRADPLSVLAVAWPSRFHSCAVAAGSSLLWSGTRKTLDRVRQRAAGFNAGRCLLWRFVVDRGVGAGVDLGYTTGTDLCGRRHGYRPVGVIYVTGAAAARHPHGRRASLRPSAAM